MKKLFLPLLCLFLIFGLSEARMTTMVVGGSFPASTSCPSWASGTLFAWDGSSTSGNVYACKGGSTEVEGTNTGGVFSGSGSDTIWTANADGDNLAWPITDADIAYDDASGLTFWVEIRLHTNSVALFVFEFIGNASNYVAMYVESNDNPRIDYKGSNTYDGANAGGDLDDSGSVWTDLGGSIFYGDAGNDISCYISSWAPDNDELAVWDESESSIAIGSDVKDSGSTVYDITRFAVVSGFEDAAPPWN